MEKGIFAKLDKRYGNRRFYQFIRELQRRIKEDRVPAVGAQLAYYLVLSFFPFILFLLTLVPYTPLANQNVLAQLLSSMPGETRNVIEPILREIISQRSAALLSTALFLSLWSGSSGMGNLLEAMGAAFDIVNARSTIIKRLFAVLFTVMLAVIILLALVSQVFGDQIVGLIERYLGANTFIETAWFFARTFIPFLIMIIGFALLFKFGPGFPVNFKITFKEALLGGAFTAVLWMAISLLFSSYVDNFSNYSRTYGSVGGIIVLLIWLYISSMVIMIGAEVNASYVAIYKGGFQERNTQAGHAGDPAFDKKRGDVGAKNQPLQPGKSLEDPASLSKPADTGRRGRPPVPGTPATDRQVAKQAGKQAAPTTLGASGSGGGGDAGSQPEEPEINFPSRSNRPEADFINRQMNLADVVDKRTPVPDALRQPRRKAIARARRDVHSAASRTGAAITGRPATGANRPSDLLSRNPERERALSTLLTAGIMFWMLKRRDK